MWGPVFRRSICRLVVQVIATSKSTAFQNHRISNLGGSYIRRSSTSRRRGRRAPKSAVWAGGGRVDEGKEVVLTCDLENRLEPPQLCSI